MVMVVVLALVEEVVVVVKIGAVIVLSVVVAFFLVVEVVTWEFVLARLVVAVDCPVLIYKIMFSIYNSVQQDLKA